MRQRSGHAQGPRHPDPAVPGRHRSAAQPLGRIRNGDQGEAAASVGCMLSRVRTGMPSDEMTCAIPGAKLAEVVDAVEHNAAADAAVARYAAQDAQRFA